MSVVFSTVNPTVESKHPWDGRLSSVAFEVMIRRVAATRAKEDIDFMMYVRVGEVWPWPRGRRKGRSRSRNVSIRSFRVVQMKTRCYRLLYTQMFDSGLFD